MSCFFCNSFFHVSQNCNVCVSDESRQEKATKLKCCHICLSTIKRFIWFGSACGECASKKKCYICFLKNSHHTVYCPDRFTAMNLFLPNIDGILFSRFLELFDLDEKYSMAFSNPNIFNIFNLKPLKVTYTKFIAFPSNQKLSKIDLILAEKVQVRQDLTTHLNLPFKFFNISPSIPIIFYIRNLEIGRSTLSSQEFSKLLSTKLKILKCKFNEFNQNWSFNEILRKAPNLKNIEFYETKNESEKWDINLFDNPKINIENNVRYLTLSIANLMEKHNVESLVAFMKAQFNQPNQNLPKKERLKISLICESKLCFKKLLTSIISSKPVFFIFDMKCFD